MRIRQLILILGTLILTRTLCGQEIKIPSDSLKFKYKNSFEFELFGNGFIYSVNYERLILNHTKYKIFTRLGISYYPWFTAMSGIWFPYSVNQLFSFKKHHLELGVGLVTTRYLGTESAYREWRTFGNFNIYYRYQKPCGRFLYKIGFTPFIDFINTDHDKISFYPSGGIVIGYNL